MTETVKIMFNSGRVPWTTLKTLLFEVGCHALAEKGPSRVSFYSVPLRSDSPELDRFRSELKGMGIEWIERRERSYTRNELRMAPLLWLSVDTAPKGNGGPTFGTQYDLSTACPSCGSGARQTSALMLKSAELPRKGDFFQTLDHEFLVSLDLAEALTRASVTGIELRRAKSESGTGELPWVQLVSEHELPPMASSTQGLVRENPCAICRRDGYFHNANLPVDIRYDGRSLHYDTLPDVVTTFELFGNSGLSTSLQDSSFAKPLVLVKPKVYDLHLESKVRGLHFVPVSIE